MSFSNAVQMYGVFWNLQYQKQKKWTYNREICISSLTDGKN